jgi:hypothetical protein
MMTGEMRLPKIWQYNHQTWPSITIYYEVLQSFDESFDVKKSQRSLIRGKLSVTQLMEFFGFAMEHVPMINRFATPQLFLVPL